MNNKHIVLGITSGIAAYKAPFIVRALRVLGAEVQVVLSDNAHRFVSATSLQAVSGRPVRQSLWDEEAEAAMGHIELARWADAIVIAPATANALANLAAGKAQDLLSTICLATTAPVLLAPAMNQAMYRHAATQRNLATLAALGYRFIGPDSGDQACGDEGPGRMSEPDDIVTALAGLFTEPVLAGKHVLITAGPTVEAIDPVRFISNHSSGKQGLALAEAALEAGAAVTLIAGPGVPECSPAVRRVNVGSAQEMHDAVHEHVKGMDMFIGVAAVADYRPVEAARQKMKRKGSKDAGISLELVENPDIIASVAALEDKPLVVGFAAETNDTMENARAKRERKGLDAIVLNDVSDRSIGFNSDDNAATLIYAQGEITFTKQDKRQLAHGLVRALADIFPAKLVPTTAQSVRT